MAAKPGVETKRLALVGQSGFLGLVERIEPADDPTLPLNVGQPNDDGDGNLLLAGLFQTVPSFRLFIPVADQHHAIELRKEQADEADRPPGRLCVGLGRASIEVTHGPDVMAYSKSFDPFPGQRISGMVAQPNPLMIEKVRFKPLDGIHQDAIGEIRGGLEIGRRFMNHGESQAHFAASAPASHFSPNRLHNSPGAISSFQVWNFG